MAKTVQCDSEQSQTEALNVEIDTAGELSTPKLNQGRKATAGQLNTIHMRQRTTKIKQGITRHQIQRWRLVNKTQDRQANRNKEDR